MAGRNAIVIDLRHRTLRHYSTAAMIFTCMADNQNMPGPDPMCVDRNAMEWVVGFGRLLIHSLVSLARDSGMSAATLEVRASNAPARALYTAQGFKEVGRRKQYYRRPVEDAIVLRLDA